MSSTSNPEVQIIEALLDRLSEVTPTVLLGYSATGLNDNLSVPAILVQLESFQEQSRQGSRIKMKMSLNISVVVKTDKESTYQLLNLTRSVRELFISSGRWIPEARNTQLSETQFDIAPHQGHLSFADIQLTIDAIL